MYPWTQLNLVLFKVKLHKLNIFLHMFFNYPNKFQQEITVLQKLI